MNPFSYWWFLGTIYLLWMTWQDYRNNRKVDDRRNWFMMGLSISIISHVLTGFLYKMVLVLGILIVMAYMKKLKTLGEADINTTAWIMMGLGLMHWSYLAIYYAIFTVFTLTFLLIKEWILRYKAPVAFYGVILLSYVCTGFLVGGYLIQ